MRVFLDANILISVLNKEYPVFTWSARVLSLADQKRFSFCTSAVCLAIAYYFAEKKSGATVAKHKMTLLAEKILIVNMGRAEVMQAANDKRVIDFEDGMQYNMGQLLSIPFVLAGLYLTFRPAPAPKRISRAKK